MFSFRNIDEFIPKKFEKMGMLRGKRWYVNTKDDFPDESTRLGLFKPKRKEFGDTKIFCANHYGEFVGYLLAIGSHTESCKAELAHLTQYFENIHKERNNGTPEEKDGCIIYSELEKNQFIEHGNTVIDLYLLENMRTDSDFRRNSNTNNNIEVILSAIEMRIREFYGSKKYHSPEYIQERVNENRSKAINMIVYDCLYGNNDRHDENWAMVKDTDGTNISLYSLYDNERVLGLYENINTIEKCLQSSNFDKSTEDLLFSRMVTPYEQGKNSSYKSVLRYLMDTYPEETTSSLQRHLKGNTPSVVRMYLESCEGLPSQYIEFGTKMYESRYKFAQDLVRKKETDKDSIKGYEISNDSEEAR